ncbi:MAG: polymerase sigma-70 factor, subfamily [Acidobacteriota bacterium]|nr:polymerase sigma-70 factor, subfamily [Acidobacteriota bacterium]
MEELRSATDAFLVGSIVNGDREAIRPLIERYQKPLLALLRRALGNSPDVDDVAQETWIRVVRSAHRFDPAQRFSAWLFAIAWNLVRDRWSRHRDISGLDLAAMPCTRDSAEQTLVEDDRAQRVREHVSALPPRFAEVILLRYFEELSEKETAARLGVPVGTVKSRIHHGLRKLAAAIGGENV